MSNQFFLWSTLIFPWLTLFFVKKDELKRFLPVSWFTIVINTIFYEVGITINFWKIREATYPFTEMPPYFFGFYPVITIWLFKFSYGKFWLYMALNAVCDAVFAFLLCPWMVSRGIFYYVSSLAVFLFAMSIAIAIYAYQMWQEDALFPSS